MIARLLRPRAAPGDAHRIVPPTGITAVLTAFVAATMSFLAVFALALLFSTDRLADRWGGALAQTATIRISAPPEQTGEQIDLTLAILKQTPGVESARPLTSAEKAGLLEPWLGPEMPVDGLLLPELIEIVETPEGLDAEGLRLRLRAEVPGAVFDDHGRWRAPLIAAADRLRMIGSGAVAAIALSLAAMVTLAASAALAANTRVIEVLRLIGARDHFVVRAFTMRFTLRALTGAAAGTLLGLVALLAIPRAPSADTFFADLGLRGAEWAVLLVIPPVAGALAYIATRLTAVRKLREMR
ncbi:cell division protein FtsX [Ovoidimarina sediminis]|uniref:cell division protein FtsX n=1 Tax=Ovoidimarina sediminis TaxID=3079856 RepID=UPI002910C600|nr:FtsX-like permease family protein [Rhodophyticola sp. MJ-SS7]MDU8944033.1 FtsX-like permease family protein [Rhodophyticola sp. MJ-SS7]